MKHVSGIYPPLPTHTHTHIYELLHAFLFCWKKSGKRIDLAVFYHESNHEITFPCENHIIITKKMYLFILYTGNQRIAFLVTREGSFSLKSM